MCVIYMQILDCFIQGIGVPARFYIYQGPGIHPSWVLGIVELWRWVLVMVAQSWECTWCRELYT